MGVDIHILPEDIKTVKILRRKQGKYINVMITFPPDIADRYDLQDKDQIVIAFVKKVKN